MPHLRTRAIVAYLAVVMPTSRQRCERHLLCTRVARVMFFAPFIERLHPLQVLFGLSVTFILGDNNLLAFLLVEHVLRWHSPPVTLKVKIAKVKHSGIIRRSVDVVVVFRHIRYDFVDVEHQPLTVDLFVNITIRIFSVNVI